MYFLHTIFAFFSCILIGINIGNTVERQYSVQESGLKRIEIEKKWEFLFRSSETKNTVKLLSSVAIRLCTIIVSIIILVMGLAFSLFPMKYRYMCVFMCFIIHCITVEIIVIVTGYKFEKKMKKNRIFAKRCFVLEVKQAFCADIVFCKVKVLSCVDIEKTIYEVQYGRLFPKRYVASVYFNYEPKIGEEVMAVYSSYDPWKTPYFELTSDIVK